jgi:hypothetical protein
MIHVFLQLPLSVGEGTLMLEAQESQFVSIVGILQQPLPDLVKGISDQLYDS